MIIMKKYSVFEDGSINPFPTFEEETEELNHEIVDFINSPCRDDKAWTTRCYDKNNKDISKDVLQFLHDNGYEGTLDGEQNNYIIITLSMRKYRLSRKGKLTGSYSLETSIQDINLEYDKIVEYWGGCPLPGNWTTRFILTMERVWESNPVIDTLARKDVTEIVTKYIQKEHVNPERGELPYEP